MNIAVLYNLNLLEANHVLYSKDSNIDMLLNLVNLKKLELLEGQLNFVSNLFKPLLKYDKLLITVAERVGVFGFNKSMVFTISLNDNRNPSRSLGFVLELFVSKFGSPSNRVVIEERQLPTSPFGPQYSLIFDSEVPTTDEFFNFINQAVVYCNCPLLGFMVTEYVNVYPSVVNNHSLKKIKPRLCSTCIYYSQSTPINCAVNLTERKQKLNVNFTCTDYVYDCQKFEGV